MMFCKFSEEQRKKIFQAVKLLLTVSLCLFIAFKADWAKILKAWQSANPFLLVVVFACMILCVTISAIKWRLLLSIHGISFKLKELHRHYFVALFINNFLPSSIGGDVYRIYKTFKNERSGAFAITAVLVERITGIWALLFLGLIFAAILIIDSTGPLHFLRIVTLIFAAAVIFPVILVAATPLMINNPFFKRLLPGKIRLLLDYTASKSHPWQKIVLVILLSFFFHLFSLGWAFLLFKAIGVNYPFFELAVTVAVSSTVAILPLSINGIGLLDGSFIYVSKIFGIGYTDALTYLLFMRAFTLIISLFGGIIYAREKDEFMKHGKSVRSV